MAQAIFADGGRPSFGQLVRLHWRRGGGWDHALLALAPFTFGLSAWLWRRWLGSCCFAGYLDRAAGRAGCLIHPLRVGEPDLRRHAFPLIPTLGCNRRLRCPMLDSESIGLDADLITVCRAGAASLKR